MISPTCAHAGCSCAVDVGETYCSEDCREAGPIVDAGRDGEPLGLEDAACPCGHPECQAVHEPAMPRPTGDLSFEDEEDLDRKSWI